MIQIGEKFINRKVVNEKWDGKDLYKVLMEFQDADAASENPMIKKMQCFYLKIHGYCNEKIIEHFDPCKACPKRQGYERFNNYNELIGFDNKEVVIVLKSKYNDFRDYKIFCAYYSSKEYNDDYMTMFELYGNTKTFFDKIGDYLQKTFKFNTL